MTEEVFAPISNAVGGRNYARKFYPHENIMECVKSYSSRCSYCITKIMPASEKIKVNYTRSFYSRVLEVNEEDREVSWKSEEGMIKCYVEASGRGTEEECGASRGEGGRLVRAPSSLSQTKAAYFTFLLQAHLLLLQSQLQRSWSYNVHRFLAS